MEVLKRKKMYEQQRDQMAGQSFNIEQTSFAIESVRVQLASPTYEQPLVVMLTVNFCSFPCSVLFRSLAAYREHNVDQGHTNHSRGNDCGKRHTGGRGEEAQH